jgi:hypothetical protein
VWHLFQSHAEVLKATNQWNYQRKMRQSETGGQERKRTSRFAAAFKIIKDPE